MQITAPVLVVPATGPARGRPVNIGLNIKYNDRNLKVCVGGGRGIQRRATRAVASTDAVVPLATQTACAPTGSRVFRTGRPGQLAVFAGSGGGDCQLPVGVR